MRVCNSPTHPRTSHHVESTLDTPWLHRLATACDPDVHRLLCSLDIDSFFFLFLQIRPRCNPSLPFPTPLEGSSLL